MQPSLPPEGGQTERARRRSAAGFHLLCSFLKGNDWPLLRGGKRNRMPLRWRQKSKSHARASSPGFRTIYFTASETDRSSCTGGARSHTQPFGVIKIPWINLPLFLIYLHLFSIKETRVTRSVLSHLITPANEIRCRLTGCRATGPVADR